MNLNFCRQQDEGPISPPSLALAAASSSLEDCLARSYRVTAVEKRDLKVIFHSKDLRLVPETRAPKEHFKLVFGSGTSSPAKIRPLKV